MYESSHLKQCAALGGDPSGCNRLPERVTARPGGATREQQWCRVKDSIDNYGRQVVVATVSGHQWADVKGSSRDKPRLSNFNATYNTYHPED